MKSLFLVLVFMVTCFATEVEIKGLKIGITKDDISKIYQIKKFPLKDKLNRDKYYLSGDMITIADSKIFDMELFFVDDKVDYINITLYSSSFDKVLDAIKGKYNNVKCTNYEIKNKLGNSFTQTECQVNDGKSYLFIKRFFELNMDRSVLEIKSNNIMQEEQKNINSYKKDI